MIPDTPDTPDLWLTDQRRTEHPGEINFRKQFLLAWLFVGWFLLATSRQLSCLPEIRMTKEVNKSWVG